MYMYNVDIFDVDGSKAPSMMYSSYSIVDVRTVLYIILT